MAEREGGGMNDKARERARKIALKHVHKVLPPSKYPSGIIDSWVGTVTDALLEARKEEVDKLENVLKEIIIIGHTHGAHDNCCEKVKTFVDIAAKALTKE